MTRKINTVAFEDALNMTGFARYNFYLFTLCSSIIIGMGFEIFSVSYIVVASKCELHTTQLDNAILTKISIFIFVRNLIEVAGAMALSITLMSECTPMNKRSLLVIASTSVFLLSSGVMAVIAIPILPLTFSYYIPVLDIYFNSWRTLNLIFALPTLISAIGVACAYESPKYLVSVGKSKEALKVLRGMYMMNTGKSGDNFQVDGIIPDEESQPTLHMRFFKSLIVQTIPMVKPPLLKHTILLGCLFVIIYICINSFMVWTPFIVNSFMSSVLNGYSHLSVCDMIRQYQNSTIFTDESNEDCSMNSFALTMVFCIQMILAVLNAAMSVLVKHIGRKKIVIGIQIVAGAACLCINLSPYWRLSAILFLTFLSGVFNFGYLTTYAVDLFPTYVKATAVCLTLMMGRGSAIFGINILKRLLDYDCDNIFYIFGGLTLFGGLVACLLPSDEKILEQNTQKT